MTLLPPAHVGHWSLWVLYSVPLLIVLGTVVVTVIQGRRRDHDERDEGPGAE